MIKLTIPRKKRKVGGGNDDLIEAQQIYTHDFTEVQQKVIDKIYGAINSYLRRGELTRIYYIEYEIEILNKQIEFSELNISSIEINLLSKSDHDKNSRINEIKKAILKYKEDLNEKINELQSEQVENHELQQQTDKLKEEQEYLEKTDGLHDKEKEQKYLEKNDESQKQDKLEIIDPIIYVKCTENFQDEYNKLVEKYNIINFVLPSDEQFIKFFINYDLSLLKKTIDLDLIKESNNISNHITNSKIKMSELLIDFSDFKKLDTGKNEDNHSIINNHINNHINNKEYEININNKLYDTTIYNIVVNSFNLINISNMLKLVSKNIIKDNSHIKLLQTQFKYYYLSCIVARIILIKHINNGDTKINYFYIKFYKSFVGTSKWIIEINITKLLFSSFKQTQGGAGKKSLSVNKIKEIADKLKVSHSKCKSKESIMNKIKSIDLQKLTIEQLKIYCKLFNIKGCSKCKSKKSLLLHTKSNMKVR